MAEIILENVTVEYPLYNTRNRSLRNQLVSTTSGGIIRESDDSIAYITALKNVFLHIKEGDCVGLTGHNGSGKSTLLKTVAGIYPPSNGKIKTSGNIMNIFDIGAGFDYDLIGLDNIYQAGYLLGINKKDIQKNIEEIIDFSELGRYIHIPIRTYSSGMIMRLMFSIATSFKPEILLMDEMFSVGDGAFQKKSTERINEIIRSSKIVIIASHNDAYIKTHCNRVFLLNHGSLEEELLS